MTYAGMPPFYPPGWFWIGGRAAALTGTPAWEMFKPWAITSIAIAVVVAWCCGRHMIRFEYALTVTTATAAVTLAYSLARSPTAAMITVLIPPVLVLAWRGLRGGGPAGYGGWAAVVGVGVFLGFTATFYTLLLGLHGVHRRGDGRAGGRGPAPQHRTAAATGRGDRRGHRGDRRHHLAAVPAARRPLTDEPTPAAPSTICPPTARC